MRRLVLFALLAACKKDPCEQAVGHAFGIHDAAGVFGLEAADMSTAKSGAVQGCKMQPWNDETKSCLAKAASTEDLAHCMTRTDLIVWQHAQLDALDPGGTRRYPELDAAVGYVRDAVGCVTASEDAVPCSPSNRRVIALDLLAARLVAQGKVPPEHPRFVVSGVDGLTSYAGHGKVYPDEIGPLRAWAAKVPAGAMWAFIETKQRVDPKAHGEDDFDPGHYEAVMHVVDAAQKTEVCRTRFTADSSDSVKTLAGSDEKVNGQMNEAMVKRDFDKQIAAAIDQQVAGLSAH